MGYRWLWVLVVLFLIDGWVAYRWYKRNVAGRYENEILNAARQYEVDPALVMAVVWRESRFKKEARGAAGEIGLMQIRSAAAHEWSEAERIRSFEHEQVADPGTNTLAGTWYLSKLLKRYTHTDDPVPYALADYNAGRSNVLRWNKGEAATNSQAFIEGIDFPTTKQYIRDVMKRREKYR